MRVSLEKLTSAMVKVRKFAEGQKNVPGVMLDINDNIMKVCYSDGKKAIIEKIEIEPMDSIINGRVIVPYVRIMSIIDSCQPSGPVFTSDLDIVFGEDNNTMVITATKKINVSSGDYNVEEKVVSKISQKIGYFKPEDSIQYQVLSRMDYNSIFNYESVDVWDKDEFKSVLNKTSTEKGKVIYISSIKKIAFVVNLAYVTSVPITFCEKYGMTMATGIASAIEEIVTKMNGNTLKIHVNESRYVNIISEDDTVGIWFEMAPASKTDASTLTKYQEKQYNKYQLVFCRPALQNIINCAIAADNNEKTMVTFNVVDDGDLALKISSSNTGTSVSNEFNMVVESYKDLTGDIMTAKIPVSLKVLSDMIGNCDGNYIAIDIASDENSSYIRISDIESVENGEIKLSNSHYTVTTK